METKCWWKSKVVWINVVTFAVLLFSLPEVGALVPDSLTKVVSALSAAGNLFLRINTSVPLGKGPQQ